MSGVERECLDAFMVRNKARVLMLLPNLSSPQTVRDSLYLEGATLVYHAARNGWDDVCKLLVDDYNCSPTTVNDYGSSPLHEACLCGREATVKYLLTLPSVLRRINDKTNDGNTALHLACGYGNIAVIETLLETNSVNITEENNDGLTPIELLRQYRYSTFARLASKIDWKTPLLVKSYFNVFLLGNSAAGKSTLAEVLLELTRATPTQHGRVSNVKELTAGVVPTQCEG